MEERTYKAILTEFQKRLLLTLEQQKRLLEEERRAGESEGPSEFVVVQEMSEREGDGA